MPDKKLCLWCGNYFFVKGKIKDGKQLYVKKTSFHFINKKYCDMDCYRKDVARYAYKGSRHPQWKGGKIDRDGYVYVFMPDHPSAMKQGYVAEHRVVMEKHIGRILKKGEVVHHIDEDRRNNKIENLKLYKNAGEHVWLEHVKRVNGKFCSKLQTA